MPAKKKTAKTKTPPKKEFKVEEVKEEKKVVEEPNAETKTEVIEEEKPKTEETTETPKVEEEAPKISSFSQLDSEKSVSEESVNEKASIMEESKPTMTPSATMDVPPQKVEEKELNEEETKEPETPTKQESSEDIKEWLKDIRPDTTKEVESKKSFNFHTFFILIIVFALIGAVVGGVYYYQQAMTGGETDQESVNTTTEETVTPTSEPTATPEPVDLTTYQVNVLNGSGVAGEAGSVKSLLSDAGFDSDNISAGNADTIDFTDTILEYKEDTPQTVLDEVKSSLEDSYTVTFSEELLDNTSDYDIIVTVGEKK
jgi:hypothetical protein